MQATSLGSCGFSGEVSAGGPSTSGFWDWIWGVCVLLSEKKNSSEQVMTGAGLAGLMGRWWSVEEGYQRVKTGGIRQGKGSRSFSVLSNRELSPAADPG